MLEDKLNKLNLVEVRQELDNISKEITRQVKESTYPNKIVISDNFFTEDQRNLISNLYSGDYDFTILEVFELIQNTENGFLYEPYEFLYEYNFDKGEIEFILFLQRILFTESDDEELGFLATEKIIIYDDLEKNVSVKMFSEFANAAKEAEKFYDKLVSEENKEKIKEIEKLLEELSKEEPSKDDEELYTEWLEEFNEYQQEIMELKDSTEVIENDNNLAIEEVKIYNEIASKITDKSPDDFMNYPIGTSKYIVLSHKPCSLGMDIEQLSFNFRDAELHEIEEKERSVDDLQTERDLRQTQLDILKRSNDEYVQNSAKKLVEISNEAKRKLENLESDLEFINGEIIKYKNNPSKLKISVENKKNILVDLEYTKAHYKSTYDNEKNKLDSEKESRLKNIEEFSQKLADINKALSLAKTELSQMKSTTFTITKRRENTSTWEWIVTKSIMDSVEDNFQWITRDIENGNVLRVAGLIAMIYRPEHETFYIGKGEKAKMNPEIDKRITLFEDLPYAITQRCLSFFLSALKN